MILLLVFYALIGEIPRWYTIERDLIQWIITIISMPIIGILASKFLTKYIEKEKRNYFGTSFFVLFGSWILLLYFKAFGIGIIDSFESGRMRILESLTGYTIYQLWIYAIFGILHGIVGGVFLGKELKSQKEKTAHNNV